MSVLQASIIHEMATKDPCRANSYENPAWHVYGGRSSHIPEGTEFQP